MYVLGLPVLDPENAIRCARPSSDRRVVLLVMRPTELGWSCRSSLRDQMNNEYINHEAFTEIVDEWIKKELTRVYVTSSRAEVVRLLANSFDNESFMRRSGTRIETYLHGQTRLSSAARAERVLQQFESLPPTV